MDNLYFLEIEDELQEQKDKVVQLLRSVLAKKTFAYRGDYTTFFRYALVLLTGDTEGFQFDKPTAVSKARWMERFVKFVCLVYVISRYVCPNYP